MERIGDRLDGLKQVRLAEITQGDPEFYVAEINAETGMESDGVTAIPIHLHFENGQTLIVRAVGWEVTTP